MRLLLRLGFPLLLIYLSGCAHLSNVDHDALEGQRIESHAVKIRMDLIIDISRLGAPVDSAAVRWVGSGAVVAVDRLRGESLVLTARHVCNVPTQFDTHFIGSFPVTAHLLSVQSAEGVLMFGDTLIEDPNADVCVVRVYGEAGTPATVASEMPPRQGHVIAAGAPHGEFGPDMVPETDGRYSGYSYISLTKLARIGVPIEGSTSLYWRINLFTFAGAPGLSGGGVYYRGKLVSVVSLGDPGFEHLIYGAALDRIHATIATAKDLWRR